MSTTAPRRTRARNTTAKRPAPARLPERDARGRLLPGSGGLLNPTGRQGTGKTPPRLLGMKLKGKPAVEAARWRRRLIRQLGGKMTPHRLALIDQAAVTKQALDYVNVWLLKHADPAQASDKQMNALLRVLKERHALIHEFARLLDRIGGVTNAKGHTKPVSEDGLAALDALRREYAA